MPPHLAPPRARRCGHCKRLVPEYKTLGEAVANEPRLKDRVVVAKVRIEGWMAGHLSGLGLMAPSLRRRSTPTRTASWASALACGASPRSSFLAAARPSRPQRSERRPARRSADQPGRSLYAAGASLPRAPVSLGAAARPLRPAAAMPCRHAATRARAPPPSSFPSWQTRSRATPGLRAWMSSTASPPSLKTRMTRQRCSSRPAPQPPRLRVRPRA